MVEVTSGIGASLLAAYQSVINILPAWAQSLVGLFLLVVLIVVYAIIIWNGYRYIARKDPLGLNLSKYNTSQDSFFAKLVAGSLYFLEYILIAPIIIFISLAIFTILLTFLTENLTAGEILLIAAAIIGAIRLTAYYKEELAKEIAKFIPFTLLAVSLLNPSFFDISRIFGTFSQLPALFNKAGIYLIFIILLEIVLILFDFIFSLFGIEETDETAENTQTA